MNDTPFSKSIMSVAELEKALSSDFIAPNFNQLKKMMGADIFKNYASCSGVDLDINAEYQVIQDVRFEPHSAALKLVGTNVKPHMLFINCSFSHIIFQSASCRSIVLVDTHLNNNFTTDQTTIAKCEFKSVRLSNISIIKTSSIGKIHSHTDCEIMSGIYVHKSSIGHLLFKGRWNKTNICFFQSTCRYAEIKGICQSVQIKDESTVENLELFENTESNKLQFHHISISKSVCNRIHANNFNTAHFFIQERATVGQAILGNTTIGDFLIHGATVQQIILSRVTGEIRIEDTAINSFKSNESVFIKFLCKGEITGKYYINEGKTGELIFNESVLTKESIFNVTGAKLNEISFNQLSVIGQLQFQEITSLEEKPRLLLGDKIFPTEAMKDNSWLINLDSGDTDWNLTQITKNGNLELSHQAAKSVPRLQITRSSMGKAEFIGSDLSGFEFHFCNSKLLEMFFAGTTLPRQDKNIHVHIKGNQSNPILAKYQQKVNLYIQLKKIFDSQGNIIEGNLYHSLAMHYQQKLLSHEIKTRSSWKAWLLELRFDDLVFRLNRFSNNHGESWWRALLFTCIITFFTFIAATWSMKYHLSVDYFFTKKGWQFLTDFQMLSDHFYKLPGFFLPTHKLEYLSEGTGYSPTFGHYCWDIISRIFIGYGIYQFISAFRRHSRKGS